MDCSYHVFAFVERILIYWNPGSCHCCITLRMHSCPTWHLDRALLRKDHQDKTRRSSLKPRFRLGHSDHPSLVTSHCQDHLRPKNLANLTRMKIYRHAIELNHTLRNSPPLSIDCTSGPSRSFFAVDDASVYVLRLPGMGTGASFETRAERKARRTAKALAACSHSSSRLAPPPSTSSIMPVPVRVVVFATGAVIGAFYLIYKVRSQLPAHTTRAYVEARCVRVF